MAGISSNLLSKLRRTLADCAITEFSNDQTLSVIFQDQRLSAYQNSLPQANSPRERIDILIAFLSNKRQYGKNVLVTFLEVMAASQPEGDDCKNTFLELAQELKAELGGAAPANNVVAIRALNSQERVTLREYLTARFSLSELRTLAFDLAIDYESLPSSKNEFTTELITYVERTGQVDAFLVTALRQRSASEVEEILQAIRTSEQPQANTQTEQNKGTSIITIYHREDAGIAARLDRNFSILRREELVNNVEKVEITSKTTSIDINKFLGETSLILLLITPDFISSEFTYNKEEISEIVKLNEKDKTRVIPIIAQPTAWANSPYGKLQALPSDGRTLAEWTSIDEGLSDILSSLRIVFQGFKNPSKSSVAVPIKEYKINDVFMPRFPKVTFVEPEDFLLLKMDLALPGQGVIIEGPSGIGKTTALNRALKDLEATGEILGSPTELSARDPDHVKLMKTLRQWHQGLVVIDDFHRLPDDLKQMIVDYIKFLADTGPLDKKLVIIGIPQTGRSLIELSFDINTRISSFPLTKVSNSKILELIQKGEVALNITFNRKDEIVLEAAGSLVIAQILCRHIAINENILKTQLMPMPTLVFTDLEKAIKSAMNTMKSRFEHAIQAFVRLGGDRDFTCIELLEALVKADEGVLYLNELKRQRPILALGIRRFLDDGYMSKLHVSYPDSDQYLFFNENPPTLTVDDPQLTFYLTNILKDKDKFAKGVGMQANSTRTRIFISYSHKEDPKWLDRLKVHLTPLERQGLVDRWDDTKIQPGTGWKESIQQALDSATVAVLLVSADFLASEFISKNELPPLLKAAQDKGTLIMPIFVKPTAKNPEISQFQGFNSPSNPLIGMSESEQESLFVRLVETIERLSNP
jgi:hypothetical protein